MAITKNASRQYPLVGRVDIAFGDFGTGGTSEDAIDIPANAVVVGGELVVLVAFDAAVTADVGDTADANRYGAAVDLASVGRTALLLTGYKHTLSEAIKVATSADVTVGSGYLSLEYIIDGRAHEAG